MIEDFVVILTSQNLEGGKSRLEECSLAAKSCKYWGLGDKNAKKYREL